MTSSRPVSATWIPHDHDDHARVLLGCPCGTTADMTFARDMKPEALTCRGCGMILRVPDPPAVGESPT